MKGVDYSWARPGGAAIKAAGFAFVMRYVPFGKGDGGHGLQADELADLRAHGLAVGLVFESSALRPLDGFVAGQQDSARAQIALRELGMPLELPIYFGVDFDAQPGQLPQIDDYLRGCRGTIGPKRVGVYGSYDVVAHCAEVGTAAWFWQTYAWSGGRILTGTHLYQYRNGQELNGGQVDYNEMFGSEAGLWTTEDELNTNDKAILDKAAVAGDQMYQQVFGIDEGPVTGYIEDESGNVFTMAAALKRIQALESGGVTRVQVLSGQLEVVDKKEAVDGTPALPD